MEGSTFDALTRSTVAVTRRSSVLALGGAALGVAVPTAAIAGKAGKKAKKKCKKQVGKCESAVRSYCEEFINGNGGFEECLDDLFPCCQPLKKCRANESTECLIDAFTIPK